MVGDLATPHSVAEAAGRRGDFAELPDARAAGQGGGAGRGEGATDVRMHTGPSGRWGMWGRAMPRCGAWLAGLALCVLGVQHAQALDIRGVTVDEPVNCQYIRSLDVRTGTYAQSCENGVARWFTEISFLNGRSGLSVSQSSKGIALTVSVSSFNYRLAVDAFTEKYGPPAVERSIIQNRAGASFDQEVSTWREGDKMLRISLHGTRIGEPSLILIGRAAIVNAEEVRRETLKKSGGNI